MMPWRAFAVAATGKLFTLNKMDFIVIFLPTLLITSVPVAHALITVTVPAVVIGRLRPARSRYFSSFRPPPRLKNPLLAGGPRLPEDIELRALSTAFARETAILAAAIFLVVPFVRLLIPRILKQYV